MNQLPPDNEKNPAESLLDELRRLFREESRSVFTRRYLTPGEAAEYMGITLSSLYRLMDNGEIKYSQWHKRGNRKIDRLHIDQVFIKNAGKTIRRRTRRVRSK